MIGHEIELCWVAIILVLAMPLIVRALRELVREIGLVGVLVLVLAGLLLWSW